MLSLRRVAQQKTIPKALLETDIPRLGGGCR